MREPFGIPGVTTFLREPFGIPGVTKFLREPFGIPGVTTFFFSNVFLIPRPTPGTLASVKLNKI